MKATRWVRTYSPARLDAIILDRDESNANIARELVQRGHRISSESVRKWRLDAEEGGSVPKDEQVKSDMAAILRCSPADFYDYEEAR